MLPTHLSSWKLPRNWRWGAGSSWGAFRHYQEVHDNLDRSLSLVTAPDPAHAQWLAHEACFLASLNHPSIPTTYASWDEEYGRGPGYLRRWIVGETAASADASDVPSAVRALRFISSALASMHDASRFHGAVSPEGLWITPSGRIWLINWQWAPGPQALPESVDPSLAIPWAPEWEALWRPTALSDQWQLARTIVSMLCHGPVDAPVSALCPAAPAALVDILSRALSADPAERYPSLPALLKDLDRFQAPSLSSLVTRAEVPLLPAEDVLRRATSTDYEVISSLGSGAFGSVWRVRDLSLARYVALKVLHPHVASDTATVSAFRREAQTAAALSHPGIVPIYDWDTRLGVSWYTMELAENGSLASLVETEGARNLSDVHGQVLVLLSALDAAHRAGVIHGDLKPENILVGRWGSWRISDFGAARRNASPAMSPGHMTPSFAAPEQLLRESVTPSIDVFSLGAVVYYALTGAPPFHSSSVLVLVARQIAGDLAVPSSWGKALSLWLSTALAPDPSDRFSSAASALEAWKALA